ncbi:DUF3185 family protein [Halorhodospira halophila]|nr:DUF3185 family protein [Halorhodospira halophila]
MSIIQIIGIVLLITGAVLLYFGYQATQSAGEQIFETFTGRFTDSTTWYLILGVAASISGLIMLFIRGG